MLPKPELIQGTLDFIVLKTLAAMGAQHGYGIALRIQQVSSDLMHLNQGSLYPALLRLEQRRLIRSEWGTSDNNRRARFYSITKAGLAQLNTEVAAWRAAVALVEKILEA